MKNNTELLSITEDRKTVNKKKNFLKDLSVIPI